MDRDVVDQAHEQNNPWWNGFPLDRLGEDQSGSQITTPLDRSGNLDRSFRSDFDDRFDNIQSHRLHIIGGPTGIGKTSTLARIARRFGRAADALEPEVFYLPCDQPVFRVGTDAPIQTAVEWFFQNARKSTQPFCMEGESGGGSESGEQVYLLADDIHLVDNWARDITEVLEQYPELQIVATVPTTKAIDTESFEQAAFDYSSDLLGHLKFHDWAVSASEELQQNKQRDELRHTLRDGFKALVMGEDPSLEADLSELVETLAQNRDLRRLVQRYLRTGDDRRLGDDVGRNIERTIYRDIPRIQSLNEPSEIHDLFALVAASVGETHSPKEWSKMVDVDRRTLDTYLNLLEKFHLLGLSTHYGHDVRRTLRLYPHDPAQLLTLTGGIGGSLSSRMTDRLYRAVLFGHCKRLANYYNGRDTPIDFWKDDDQVVDFVFDIDVDDSHTESAPLPITFLPAGDSVDTAFNELRSFLNGQNIDSAGGLVVAAGHSDEVAADSPYELRPDGLVIPAWLFLFIV